jgi:hypothetical protein
MKNYYILSFLLFISMAAFAQEDQISFTRDIGFNTNFIFRGIFETDQTPFSLMYKKYQSDDKAVRLGLSVSAQLSNTSGDAGNYNNTSSIGLSFSWGKEFQKKLSNHWTWYFGYDVIPSVSYHAINYYNSGDKVQQYRTSGIGVSGRPFLGIRFDINQRLYVAAEASASLSYSYNSMKVTAYNPENVLQDTDTNNLGLRMNGASGIFIFYRF